MLELQNSMSSMILHALDERLPKGDIKMQGNHENVEEIKIESQNHDYSSLQDPHHQGFNVAPRNYFIPKIDMRKFDGKDPITWIFQMEQFFDLHQVPSLQKVPIASLYLENDQFVWYQWLCERKNNYIISWSIFMDELISHYGDIKRNTFFSQLINLWTKRSNYRAHSTIPKAQSQGKEHS
jgi:hypothetical protein